MNLKPLDLEDLKKFKEEIDITDAKCDECGRPVDIVIDISGCFKPDRSGKVFRRFVFVRVCRRKNR